MGLAPLRPCLGSPRRPRCTALTDDGPRCPSCAASARGTTSSLGYGADWKRFRTDVQRELLRLGIGWFCGARLPGAPMTRHSQCPPRQPPPSSRSLHLDHIVPHKGDEALRLSPLNVQVLCPSCHSLKTDREDGGFGRIAEAQR